MTGICRAILRQAASLLHVSRAPGHSPSWPDYPTREPPAPLAPPACCIEVACPAQPEVRVFVHVRRGPPRVARFEQPLDANAGGRGQAFRAAIPPIFVFFVSIVSIVMIRRR